MKKYRTFAPQNNTKPTNKLIINFYGNKD